MKLTDKIIYVAGTCFEKKAKVKNIGNNTQYIFFLLYIAKIKQ